MRSFILAAALALSISAFPAPNARDISIVDALVARTPQYGPFRDRDGSDDDDEDEVPAWAATNPKPSPKLAPKPAPRPAPKPAGGPPPPKTVIPTPNSSSPSSPRQGFPPKGKPDSDDEEDEEDERAPRFSTEPKGIPSSWSSGRPSAPIRPLPKGGPAPRPFTQPQAQQPKPKSGGPPPPKEPPFPDSEEDDEKIKAVNRTKREPNLWEQ